MKTMNAIAMFLCAAPLLCGVAACSESEPEQDQHSEGEHEHADGEHAEHSNHAEDGHHAGASHSDGSRVIDAHEGEYIEIGTITVAGAPAKVLQLAPIQQGKNYQVLEIHAGEGAPQGSLRTWLGNAEGEALGPPSAFNFDDKGHAHLHLKLIPELPENPYICIELGESDVQTLPALVKE